MYVRLLQVLATIFLLVSILLAGCADNSGTPPPEQGHQLKEEGFKVIATTSLIADIVRTVGEDKVAVTSLIPPASCPGHFDVKPDDMQGLANARLFLLHNWQGEQFSDDMIRSAGNADLHKVVLTVEGNWMAPPVQVEAIDAITVAMSEADPENANVYQEAARKLKEEVQRVGSEQKKRLDNAKVSQVSVLVNDMQAGFIKWAGFNVAGVFSRAEDMSPKDIEDLINLGREKGVTLVVDNLQSGKEAGIGIAREIGAAQVTLSNFPGGLPGTDSWSDAIKKNVDLVLETLPK